MRESVPSPRYSPVCNVLRQWKTSLIPTYRVYRLYDKRVFLAAVNTYVSLPIFRGLDARGGKNYEQAHTHTRDNHSNDNNNYYKFFEALKLIRITYTVLMQNRSCVSKHVTESIRNIARGVGIN